MDQRSNGIGGATFLPFDILGVLTPLLSKVKVIDLTKLV